MSDRIRELVRMTSLGQGTVGETEALFAARYDTPEGQFTLQQLHDAAAQNGAVCTPSNATARMASRHEASAVQGIHDLVVEHGAHCSTTAGARFSAVEQQRAEVVRLERENADERAALDQGRVARARQIAATTTLGRAVFAGREKDAPDGVRRSDASHPAVKAAVQASIPEGHHAFVLEDSQGLPIDVFPTPGAARDAGVDLKGNRTFAIRTVHPATCEHTLPSDRAGMSGTASTDRVQDLINMTSLGRSTAA